MGMSIKTFLAGLSSTILKYILRGVSIKCCFSPEIWFILFSFKIDRRSLRQEVISKPSPLKVRDLRQSGSEQVEDPGLRAGADRGWKPQ